MNRPHLCALSAWPLLVLLLVTSGHARDLVPAGIATGAAQFIARGDVPYSTRDNLQLTSVLVAGGPPHPGSTFTVMRKEPAAFGKFQRKVMAVSGPQDHAGFSLSPGRYLVEVRNGVVTRELAVEVPPVGTAYREIILDAGELELSSRMSADGEPAEQTWFRIFREARDAYGRPTRLQIAGDGYASRASFLLPAGSYLAEAIYGNTRRVQPLRVTAGASDSHEFVLDAAMLELSAVLSRDGEPAAGCASVSTASSSARTGGSTGPSSPPPRKGLRSPSCCLPASIWHRPHWVGRRQAPV